MSEMQALARQIDTKPLREAAEAVHNTNKRMEEIVRTNFPEIGMLPPSAATVRVALGGQEFRVQKFTIGQHERISEMLASLPARQIPREVLTIALGDASPSKTAEEIEQMRLTFEEVNEAVKAILLHSGYRIDAPAQP